MQDTSIKGNGTSRFIKGASNFPVSFDEFRRQIVAGTLTADIGLNPAGCDVVGTALSKANLLTEETSQKIGLMTKNKTVNEAIEKLFTFADDGKKSCASAVSAMGVPTAGSATFDTIAGNIRKIKTGSDVSGVTATQLDVRKGKYYVNSSGTLLQGTMHELGTKRYVPGTSDRVIYAGQYLNGNQTIAGDSNLSAENIKKGVSIFGITGSLDSASVHENVVERVSAGQYRTYIEVNSLSDLLMLEGHMADQGTSGYVADFTYRDNMIAVYRYSWSGYGYSDMTLLPIRSTSISVSRGWLYMNSDIFDLLGSSFNSTTKYAVKQ